MEGKEQKRDHSSVTRGALRACSGPCQFKKQENEGMATQNSAKEEARMGTFRNAEHEVHAREETVAHEPVLP